MKSERRIAFSSVVEFLDPYYKKSILLAMKEGQFYTMTYNIGMVRSARVYMQSCAFILKFYIV